MTVPGASPLNYPANTQPPIYRISRARAPTSNDYKNVREGDEWLDTASMDWYKLADITGTTATWVLIGGTPGSLQTLTGDSGGAVGPDGAFTINVLGTGSIVTTGNPGTNTLTIGDSGDVATTYTTDAGTATPSSNNVDILGGSNVNTSGTGDAVTINLDANITVTSVTADTVNSGIVNVDPGASGDSVVQFDINSTGEFRVGVDDDDGDTFKISQGSALGTNDTFVMTPDGERTLPLQPRFRAVGAGGTNVTGDATAYIIGSSSAWGESYDIGSNFNTNGTFTAPVTGTYYFYHNVLANGFTSSHTRGFTYYVVNATTQSSYMNLDCGNVADVSGNEGFQGADIFSLSAGDTVTLGIQVDNGTKVITINNGALTNVLFTGYLLY